jgi:hypothetical protein
VQADALEVRAETELDHLELRQLREDAMVPRRADDALAAVGPVGDSLHATSMSDAARYRFRATTSRYS